MQHSHRLNNDCPIKHSATGLDRHHSIPYKYRLAYVVEERCVLRYDNERGKGDHRHTETTEGPYAFSTPDQLMDDFEADIARWNNEHRRS